VYLGFEKAGVTKLYTNPKFSVFGHLKLLHADEEQLILVFLLSSINYCIKWKWLQITPY